MQVTLTPHAEELLREELIRHPGQSPAEVLEQALAERVRREAVALPAPKQISPEDFQAALDRIAQFSDKIPALPVEAFSRESFYEDRD